MTVLGQKKGAGAFVCTDALKGAFKGLAIF